MTSYFRIFNRWTLGGALFFGLMAGCEKKITHEIKNATISQSEIIDGVDHPMEPKPDGKNLKIGCSIGDVMTAYSLSFASGGFAPNSQTLFQYSGKAYVNTPSGRRELAFDQGKLTTVQELK